MEHRFDTDKYAAGYIPYYLERVRSPRRLLEVGVRNGGSLQLWCELWPSLERVVGLDIQPPLPKLHPRIVVLQADQNDAPLLDRIASEYGPFDLVIDDASHFGNASWTTFCALWPHVVPGGIYVIEDWGTGYRSDWPDGAEYQPGPPPGHVSGMAGTIKRLVDEIEGGQVERLDLLMGLAFAFKAG